MKTYWISFANEKNLGCCIVDADSEEEAYDKTTNLKINPGGEVLILEMGSNAAAQEEINQFGKNRLISPEELYGDGYKNTTQMDPEVVYEILSIGTIICGGCNDSECKDHE